MQKPGVVHEETKPTVPGLRPGGGPKQRDLRVAWISSSVLAFGVLFLSWYPLGGNGAALAISYFRDLQQTVLLFTVPPGLGLAAGFVLSFSTRPEAKMRFLWGGLLFFLFQLSLTGRFPWFAPFYIWCSGMLPNPAGWGLILVSSTTATFLSFRMDPLLREARSRKRLTRLMAAGAAVILSGQAVFLGPAFYVEWRSAPAVLDAAYTLAWELSVPADNSSSPAGFWFPSRQLSPDGLTPLLEFSEPPAVSESEEGIFVTDRWIGCIRLTDGEILWGKDFAFRVSGERRDSLSVYIAEDRVHVIVRGPFCDIHTFRKSDGELMWELRDLGFKYGPIGDPRVGAVATPNFILATYGDGRPSYMVIDSRTGSVTEHTLPVPDGMRVPFCDDGASRRLVGPAVLEGYGGAIAIAAYFSDVDTVPDYWRSESPLPEEGHLFGIDRRTGDIAWHVRGVGNWREDLTWPLKYLWFDGSNVVWTGGSEGRFVGVWETATGLAKWSRSFPSGVNCIRAGPGGVVVRETGGVLRFFDVETGDLRWSYDPGDLNTHAVFFMEDTLVLGLTGSMNMIRTSDGTLMFSINAPYRIRRVQGGYLAIELTDTTSSRTVLINCKTGQESAPIAEDFAGPWELSGTRYLLSLRGEGEGDNTSKPRHLFKAKGEIALFNMFVRPVQNFGSLGEVTEEGGILVTAYDERARVYHVYLVRGPG